MHTKVCVCVWGGCHAMPCFRWLVANLSRWGTGFDLSPVHMEFVVDKVALRQIPPQVL